MIRHTSRAAVAAVAVLMLLAAAPVPSEDWERRGNEAFEAGQYDEAMRLYALAEERSAEPGRVAYNAGLAHFNKGRYRDAERLFRSALESAAAERKPRVLYNLGLCLLHASAGRDANRLADAISCFGRCQKLVEIDERLKGDAEHNLELAKQLWRRIRSDAPPPDRDPDAKDDRSLPPDSRDRNGGNEPGTEPGGPNGPGGAHAVPVPMGADGPKPIPTDQKPGPGQGKMTPLSDTEQLQPLPAHEARELLRHAADRIARERRALQHAGAAEMRSYPDW